MSRLSSVVALVLAIIAGPARGEDLAALLAGATAAAHPSATVRGEGELVTTSPDGSVRARVAVLQRANGDVYVEVQPPGARALIPVGGNALLSEKPGARPTSMRERLAEHRKNPSCSSCHSAIDPLGPRGRVMPPS